MQSLFSGERETSLALVAGTTVQPATLMQPLFAVNTISACTSSKLARATSQRGERRAISHSPGSHKSFILQGFADVLIFCAALASDTVLAKTSL
jgi:hypothetical protein